MPVSPRVTVPEFVQVFPDSVGYMTKLAKYYLLAQTPLPPAPPPVMLVIVPMVV